MKLTHTLKLIPLLVVLVGSVANAEDIQSSQSRNEKGNTEIYQDSVLLSDISRVLELKAWVLFAKRESKNQELNQIQEKPVQAHS